MNEKYKTLTTFLDPARLKINEPLSDHTTFRIGGPADLYYEVESEEELILILRTLKDLAIPYFIIGGGSNLLVGDKGFRGLVIKNQNAKIKIQNDNAKCKIFADAGLLISTMLNKLTKSSVSGLEFMAGIPGTVGGAVRGNAGAWQEQMGDKVTRVKILSNLGEIEWLDKNKCGFAYRDSRFKQGLEIILEVEFELEKGILVEIEHKIAINLENRSSQPKEPSAGCIFVNLKPQSAGTLIDQAGLKGTKIGGAMISEKHANFIVNTGGAKAAEVVALIDLARSKVKEKFGVALQEEIVRIGEF